MQIHRTLYQWGQSTPILSTLCLVLTRVDNNISVTIGIVVQNSTVYKPGVHVNRILGLDVCCRVVSL